MGGLLELGTFGNVFDRCMGDREKLPIVLSVCDEEPSMETLAYI